MDGQHLWNGHKDVVNLLLDHSDRIDRSDIDLNARTNDGWTALMLARYNGHNDVVKLLISKLSICVIL